MDFCPVFLHQCTASESLTMTPRALLDHQYTVAAFVLTWLIQLAYCGWVAFKFNHIRRR